MRLLTYQMPDELIAIASQGEFDEFDLNAFFEATGTGTSAEFKHKDDVQKWLDIIRGAHLPTQVERAEVRHAAAVPVLGRAAAAVPAALVLVPAERRRVPRDGEPACARSTTSYWHDYDVLDGRRHRRRHRARRAAARAQGDRYRASTRRRSRCRAAS